jgi:hypothetical protein
MERGLPSWFKADEVFEDEGRWYFGSLDALHIGPYASEAMARSRAKQVATRLKLLENEGDRIRYVRKVLHHEWKTVGATSSPATREPTIALTPPPEPVRQGEEQQSWYRSDRFFQVEGVWFFSTREGIDVGPYGYEAEARKHERRLVRLLLKARDPDEAYRVIYEYKHQPPDLGDWQESLQQLA